MASKEGSEDKGYSPSHSVSQTPGSRTRKTRRKSDLALSEYAYSEEPRALELSVRDAPTAGTGTGKSRSKRHDESSKEKRRKTSNQLARTTDGTVKEGAVEVYHEGSLALSTVEPHRFRRECVKQLENPDYSDLKMLVKSVHEMTSRARNNELCVNCYEEVVDHNGNNMNLCVSCTHVNLARCHYCQMQYESTEFLERLRAPGRFPTCLDCANRTYSMGQPNFCEFCKRHCAWKSSWTGSDSVPSNRFRNFCDMCCIARQRSKENPKDCPKCKKSSLFAHPHGAKSVCVNCDVVRAPGRESIHFFFMDPAVAKEHARLIALPLEELRRRLDGQKEEFSKKELRQQELMNRFHTQEGVLVTYKAETNHNKSLKKAEMLAVQREVAELEGKLSSIDKEGKQRIAQLQTKLDSDQLLGAKTRVRTMKESEDKTSTLRKLEKTIMENHELKEMERIEEEEVLGAAAAAGEDITINLKAEGRDDLLGADAASGASPLHASAAAHSPGAAQQQPLQTKAELTEDAQALFGDAMEAS